MNTEQERAAFEALELIAATDPIEAALDPQRAIRVARAAMAATPAAPPGFVLVPVEPTVGMLQAALENSRYGEKRYGVVEPVAALPHCYEMAAAQQAWAAMLAAAPKQEASKC